jgi:hypothetical protein
VGFIELLKLSLSQGLLGDNQGSEAFLCKVKQLIRDVYFVFFLFGRVEITPGKHDRVSTLAHQVDLTLMLYYQRHTLAGGIEGEFSNYLILLKLIAPDGVFDHCAGAGVLFQNHSGLSCSLNKG